MNANTLAIGTEVICTEPGFPSETFRGHVEMHRKAPNGSTEYYVREHGAFKHYWYPATQVVGADTTQQ